MKKAENIDYLLQHLTSLLSRHYDQVLLEQLGIGYAQFKILNITNSSPPVKQRYIVNVLGQTEASVSRQIKILTKQGLLTSQKDPLNKRVNMIIIKKKGREICEASMTVLNHYYSPIYSKLAQKTKSQLIESLDELHRQVCLIEHSPDSNYVNYLTST